MKIMFYIRCYPETIVVRAYELRRRRHERGPGAFLAAAVWGGQWGGHIFIWGWARISDDIMHD